MPGGREVSGRRVPGCIRSRGRRRPALTTLRARYRVHLGFGIFTERWNREFDLSGEALRRIQVIGVGVDFDIYADSESTDDG